MKKTIKVAAFTLFHVLVTSYACVLFVVCVTNIVFAQEERNYRIENLEQRMAEFDALKLDQRLVRIETILNSMQDQKNGSAWVSNAADGGIALLLLRAVYSEFRRKRGIE